ncbi:MAG TPA: hypothetical protein VGG68_11555 [Caulobacteraceae bacterium]|jgi:hypothetical protein
MSNPISDIGALFSGGQAVSNLASGAKGGTSPENVNIPPFYSSGGITPEQETLAKFGKSEADVATGQTFGSSGTGMSTMETQGTAGNRMGQAVAEGTASNTNEDALYNAYKNEQSAAIQGLSNQSTLSNLATQQLTQGLTQLGKTASTAASNTDFSQGAADIFNTTGS